MIMPLPPQINFENPRIFKKLIEAHKHLAELKGLSQSIPNQRVLINTLALQEAKDSSKIENIITTHDEVFATAGSITSNHNPAAKEVVYYGQALQAGYEKLSTQGFITRNTLLHIQEELERNNAGFRKQTGTALVDDRTGEVIYRPPEPQYIEDLIDNLLAMINDDTLWTVDPLIKMAVIHYQFESIHPFHDGNGRTGRILNVLYLVKVGLLDMPVLYLSRFINQNKSEYYRLLQSVRDNGTWEEWVLFILEGIARTALTTCRMVASIRDAMNEYKHLIRLKHPTIYSQDLINNLFFYPYTKIELIQRDLKVSYHTARKYLGLLADDGLLLKTTIWRSSYYINIRLMDILRNAERESLRL